MGKLTVYGLAAFGAFSFLYGGYAWYRSGILVSMLGGLLAASIFWALAAWAQRSI